MTTQHPGNGDSTSRGRQLNIRGMATQHPLHGSGGHSVVPRGEAWEGFCRTGNWLGPQRSLPGIPRPAAMGGLLGGWPVEQQLPLELARPGELCDGTMDLWCRDDGHCRWITGYHPTKETFTYHNCKYQVYILHFINRRHEDSELKDSLFPVKCQM